MKTMGEEKNFLEEILEKLKPLKDFRDLPQLVRPPKPRGNYALTPDAMERWAFKLVEAERHLEHCKHCQGKCFLQDGDTGLVPVITVADNEVHIAYKVCEYELQRMQMRRQMHLLKSSQVPRRYANISRADYRRKKGDDTIIDVAKRCIAGTSVSGAFFYGARGTGKTMLAAIIANERLKKGLPVLFCVVPNLLADIRDAIRSGKAEEVVRTAMNTPFLILDDLGAERMTEWVGERLYTIINHRYNEDLTTIITSNFEPDELAERMMTRDSRGNIIDDTQGQRIVSRIVGMCDILYFGEQDWREQNAVQRFQHENS